MQSMDLSDNLAATTIGMGNEGRTQFSESDM
jgi:hypothetical protein